MVGGVAMSGVIKKLSVGRHAAFNQVTRGACNRVYVNTAPETTCGAGRYEKLALALSAASYLHNRRFFRGSWRFWRRRRGVPAAVASSVKVRNDAHDDNNINLGSGDGARRTAWPIGIIAVASKGVNEGSQGGARRCGITKRAHKKIVEQVVVVVVVVVIIVVVIVVVVIFVFKSRARDSISHCIGRFVHRSVSLCFFYVCRQFKGGEV